MAAPIVRRSLLYVPASSARMLSKSLGLSSDNITYDLEDAVTESAKPAARLALKAHLESLAAASGGTDTAMQPRLRRHGQPNEVAIRINALSTVHALADLTTLGARALSAVDAIVVPKVQSASDLSFVAEAVRHIMAVGRQQPCEGQQQKLPPPKLIALIESARAVMDLREICSGAPVSALEAASSDPDTTTTTKTAAPLLDGLIFAAEDFALDLSLTRTPSLSEFLYARSAVVTAARAFGLPSALDLVCTAFRGEAGLATLADECIHGRTMGFTGKQCIHPSQVDTVQRVFGRVYDDDDRRQLAWAVRVLVAADKAAAAGRGAFALDGAMVDAPVIGKARQLLALAERSGAGGFLAELRQTYRDQEPE